VPATLTIELDDDHRQPIAPETSSFETTGGFDIVLDNLGTATHVHLSLSEELDGIADIEANNHYVEGASTRYISVDVGALEDPVDGRIEIVTGYGRNTEHVAVRIVPADVSDPPVEIDDALAEPSPRPESTDLTGLSTIPVIVLGALAVVTALATALVIGTLAVWIAAAVVVVGVGVAVYLLAA
jgi:hypothetical protein